MNSFLGNTQGWIENLPTAMLHGAIVAAVIACMFALAMVVKNVAGYKSWVLATYAGKKVDGCNVSIDRGPHTAARSAAFVAVFVSTHVIAMATVFFFVWGLATLLGWSRFHELAAGHETAVLSFVIAYFIVKLWLNKIVANKWLSDKGSAKRPRALEDYVFCLSIYHAFTGILAAAQRIVFYVPFMFYQFCSLDESMFPPRWQAYDAPYRAFQANLQHHTRTTNPLAFVFAEELFNANRSFRARSVAGSGIYDEDGGSPAARRAVNRWWLAITLARNPDLTALRKHTLAANAAEDGVQGELQLQPGHVVTNPVLERDFESSA